MCVIALLNIVWRQYIWSYGILLINLWRKFWQLCVCLEPCYWIWPRMLCKLFVVTTVCWELIHTCSNLEYCVIAGSDFTYATELGVVSFQYRDIQEKKNSSPYIKCLMMFDILATYVTTSNYHWFSTSATLCPHVSKNVWKDLYFLPIKYSNTSCGVLDCTCVISLPPSDLLCRLLIVSVQPPSVWHPVAPPQPATLPVTTWKSSSEFISLNQQQDVMLLEESLVKTPC